MPSQKSWGLQVDPSIYKKLKKLRERDAKAILAVIGLLPANPYIGDVRKLRGLENAWRKRAGSYRIFYKLLVPEKIILVFHVERRTSTTYSR